MARPRQSTTDKDEVPGSSPGTPTSQKTHRLSGGSFAYSSKVQLCDSQSSPAHPPVMLPPNRLSASTVESSCTCV